MQRTVLSSLLILSFFSGCGGSDNYAAKRPKTVPGAGILTFQGKPLPEALVIYSPTVEGGAAALARTDEDGKFELMTFPPNRGIVPGSYKIAVSLPDQAPPVATSLESHDTPPPKPKKTSLVPAKYNNPESSGLTATISEEGDLNLKIELK